MRLKQILGLQCRHAYLSMPIGTDEGSHRTCNACGEQFPFVSYTLSDEDKARHDHYTTRERSITRVGNSILRFRKRKEQR